MEELVRLLTGDALLYSFALVFFRSAALFTTAPLFRGRNVPALAKIGIAFLLSLLITPQLPYTPAWPVDLASLAFLVSREVAIGLLLGSIVNLIFVAIQGAGQLVDMSMGFQMVNLLAPLSESQLPLMGNFYYLLAVLTFLSLNGHLLLFRAMTDSLLAVPAGEFSWTLSLDFVLLSFTRVLFIALQIALPLLGAALFLDILLGLMAKAVPQMNVFIVGMPAKILGLMFVLLAGVPALLLVMERTIGEFFLYLFDWLAAGVVQ